MVKIPDLKEAELRSRIVSVDSRGAHVEIHRGDWQNSETDGYNGESALYNPDTGRSCCVGIIARLEGFHERVLEGHGDLLDLLPDPVRESLAHEHVEVFGFEQAVLRRLIDFDELYRANDGPDPEVTVPRKSAKSGVTITFVGSPDDSPE